MKHNIDKFKIGATYILLICSFLNIILFFSFENLLALILTNFSWLISTQLLLRKENLYLYPMSTIMLIGYNLFFIILPLPATLIEFKPLIFNLKNPIETFFNIFILNLTLIIFHLTYKKIFHYSKRKFLTNIFIRYNFFRKFSAKEILLMSFISLIIFGGHILFVGRWSIDENNESTNFFAYIANLQPYMLLPILFIFPQFNLLKKYANISKYRKISWLFMLLISIIGLASNVRTIIVSYASQIFISILFLYLIDRRKEFIKLRFLVLIIFLPILKDVSLAMVIVRSEKFNLTGKELIEKTITVFNDKELLDKMEKIYSNNKLLSESWDEKYLDNDLLNRFCSVKNIDETIYYANRVGFANKKMREDYLKKIVFMLPNSFTSLLGYSYEERLEINSYSESDYLFTIGSNEYGLGTFRIGSISGLGLSLFGYYYLFLFGLISFILFYIFDSTILIYNKKTFFSVWSFINLFYFFYILSSGHNFHSEVRYIIRGFAESIIFYFIFIFLIKKIIPKKLLL